jgi:hypothetical protein
MPCRGCEVLYLGLDQLTVEKIEMKILDLVQAFAKKISGETRKKWQWSDNEILAHLQSAIAAESGPRGLGDIIETVAHALGLRQRAGCNCRERQKLLNQKLPLK